MTSKSTTPRREPHWLVSVAVGAVLALVLGWLGFNDWRVPWVDHGTGDTRVGGDTSASSAPPTGGATAPVVIDFLEGGAIDVRWSLVTDPALRGYSVRVTAVRPLEYEYSVPRYGGDPDVTERLYPARYLNQLLEEAADPRRVKSGQVWHVCVQGMEDTPLNSPIDDYIIPGTKACSVDFTLK